jgi:hypothetical protein
MNTAVTVNISDDGACADTRLPFPATEKQNPMNGKTDGILAAPGAKHENAGVQDKMDLNL